MPFKFNLRRYNLGCRFPIGKLEQVHGWDAAKAGPLYKPNPVDP